MITLSFAKKLKQYSSLVAPVLAVSGFASGQVIYTDVDPDYVLSDAPGGDGEGKVIDLDNDGINDFTLAVFSSISNGGSLMINRAGAQPYLSNGNGIMGFSMSGSSHYVSALQTGAAIDSTKNFWNYLGYYGSMVWYSLSIQGTFGEWSNAIDKYMGVRFVDGSGNLHYGWVRMDVQNNPIKIILKDFAYEQTQGKGIYAGSTISLGQNQVNPDNELNIFAFDKDVWIQVVPNSNSKLIISISDITGKVVYNHLTYESSFHLSMNNYDHGIYLVTAIKDGRQKTCKVFIQ